VSFAPTGFWRSASFSGGSTRSDIAANIRNQREALSSALTNRDNGLDGNMPGNGDEESGNGAVDGLLLIGRKRVS
jgi:hypothetical protein